MRVSLEPASISCGFRHRSLQPDPRGLHLEQKKARTMRVVIWLPKLQFPSYQLRWDDGYYGKSQALHFYFSKIRPDELHRSTDERADIISFSLSKRGVYLWSSDVHNEKQYEKNDQMF
jgi:hypothetical protein